MIPIRMFHVLQLNKNESSIMGPARDIMAVKETEMLSIDRFPTTEPRFNGLSFQLKFYNVEIHDRL